MGSRKGLWNTFGIVVYKRRKRDGWVSRWRGVGMLVFRLWCVNFYIIF